MNEVKFSQLAPLVFNAYKLEKFENHIKSLNIDTGDVCKKTHPYRVAFYALTCLAALAVVLTATVHLPVMVPITLGVATIGAAYKLYRVAKPLICNMLAKEAEYIEKIPKISKDVFSEILEKLPPKALIRFRLVNKTFRDLFKSVITKKINREQIPLNDLGISKKENALKFLQLLGPDDSKKIEFFKFVGFPFRIKFIESLTRITPNLKYLLLDNGFPASDAYLKCLSKFTHLKKTNFGDCKELTDEGIRLITPLDQLEEITMLNAQNITNTGLQALANQTQLKKLSLTFNRQINDNGLLHLSALSQLTHLDLAICRTISGAGIWQAFNNSPLKSLDLRFCPQIGDHDLQQISQFTTLEELVLWGNQFITGAGLQSLANLSHLKILTIHSHPRIPRDDLDVLSSRIPGLQILTG